MRDLTVEFTTRRGIQCFVQVHKPSGKRPPAFERLETALDQQHLELAFIEPKDDAIDCERRTRIFVGIGHGALKSC